MPLERIGPFQYQRFAPSLPGLDANGTEPRHHRVLIAGGGPVGLAVALGLARQGIDSVIIEADDSVCEGSRAACISRRSLEILDRLGVAPAFLAKGLPWTRGRSYYGTTEVLAFDMPSRADDKYPPMINLQQYYIEQFLLDAINAVNQRHPGRVDIRWASKIVHCAPAPDGVTVHVANALGRYQASADWLVACDGGQSFIRSSLGLELKGTGYQGRYAIVDIELASGHPAERRAWFDPPWARGTTILMHRQPDNLWRVDYQLAGSVDAAHAMQPDQINRFVQTHLDAIGEGHLPWTPVWTSVYRAGAMTLDAYRHGRILFAGNAAHAMPIFGVRGLNSGFDDADNLVWKLAAVVQGKGADALLDSYSHERVHAFHVNAESAMRSTEFMSPPNRGFELMREACLSLAERHPGIARLINPRQTHAITYTGSPLSSGQYRVPDPPPAEANKPHPAAPGAPLTDARLPDGRHLTDLLAVHGFTLLTFGPWAPADALQTSTHAPDWPRLPCRAVALPPGADLSHALGLPPAALAGAALLVRPDGHLCAGWHAPALSDVLTALEHACGAQGAQQ
ncbi:FAD-dependent monooxygenase [Achromobacter sp. UMC71]|uniref:FAD-dependent monooxygenase n=1 Tax=Achromobacter sp. UMC71 TaxID=1862320 RepID=UPI0016045C91|nr:FAD-dependent monooxygenase [Achromobacter sp. UMC71]MBB1625924.1 FAD-dependent oxidoreductase [Achromobacter sp. UMC71]